MHDNLAKNQQIRLAILQALAEIHPIENDYFFRCQRFRDYVWGSGALINSGNFATLRDIVAQFQTLYPGTANYSIGYFYQGNRKQIVEEARQAGHTVYCTKVMYTPVSELQPVTRQPFHDECIRIVNDEAAWALYRQHEGRCHPAQWYVEEGYAKKRFATEKLNLQWFALFNEPKTQIVSSAGLLKVGNLAQLKNVQTNPGEQKKGYATAVLGSISRQLRQQEAIKEVYLTIDSSNEQSFRLYSKLGFKLLPYEFVEIVVRS